MAGGAAYLNDTRRQAMLIIFGDSQDRADITVPQRGSLPMGTHFHEYGGQNGIEIYELVGPAGANTLAQYVDTSAIRTWRKIT